VCAFFPSRLFASPVAGRFRGSHRRAACDSCLHPADTRFQMVLLAFVLLVSSVAGTTSCQNGFQNLLSVSALPSTPVCFGSTTSGGLQVAPPTCDPVASGCAEGSYCYTSSTGLINVGACSCQPIGTPTCCAKPLATMSTFGSAVSGVIVASVISTNNDQFTVTSGSMSTGADNGSCSGFVAATGAGMSVSTTSGCGSAGTPCALGVSLSFQSAHANTQFAFQITCTNALQSCNLISNQLANENPNNRVCTTDDMTTTTAATTTVPTTTASATTTPTTQGYRVQTVFAGTDSTCSSPQSFSLLPVRLARRVAALVAMAFACPFRVLLLSLNSDPCSESAPATFVFFSA
jgi:hypothetical protein